jgi:hypothetical protein
LELYFTKESNLKEGEIGPHKTQVFHVLFVYVLFAIIHFSNQKIYCRLKKYLEGAFAPFPSQVTPMGYRLATRVSTLVASTWVLLLLSNADRLLGPYASFRKSFRERNGRSAKLFTHLQLLPGLISVEL